MAHIIIFTDRAPRTWAFGESKWNTSFFNYPAGAYKIASELRKVGFQVLVVPNCLNLSYRAVKKIIDNNSDNLLWAGISSTLLFMRSNNFKNYRDLWHQSDDYKISLNNLLDNNGVNAGVSEMVWGESEINRIAQHCERYNAHMLLGGSWTSSLVNGNFQNLNKNCVIVKGYAEDYAVQFTKNLILQHSHRKKLPLDNSYYDKHLFKSSSLQWHENDFIHQDAWLPLEISRGCAFNCAYCTFPKRNNFDSYKHAQSLYNELVYNYETFGVTRYMLVDDLYNDSKDKVRILYDQVWSKLPFNIEWSGYMRLDMFWADPESIDIVKASGAKIGSFGIETLHDKAGRSVGKGLGKDRVLETLSNLKTKWDDDVLVQGYFIAGVPHEDKQSIQDTMSWTLETDLLFSSQWSPMWITPPSHIPIVNLDQVNNLSKDNDKWQIRWLDQDNWINSAGVTKQEVDSMCNDLNKKIKKGMSISFADYADLRTAGIDHKTIASSRSKGFDDHILKQGIDKIQIMIDDRLDKVLQTSSSRTKF